MKLMPARLASQPGKAVVARVQNAVTDWAFLHPLKLLVKIAFPSVDRLCYCAVLVAYECRERKQPFSALHFTDAQTSGTFNIHMAQRVTAREAYDKINSCLLLLVCSNNFVRRAVNTN